MFWIIFNDGDDWDVHPVGWETQEDAQAQIDLWVSKGLATYLEPMRIIEAEKAPEALATRRRYTGME